MGWTHDELDRQPAYRIAQDFMFLEEEAKFREWQAKQPKR